MTKDVAMTAACAALEHTPVSLTLDGLRLAGLHKQADVLEREIDRLNSELAYRCSIIDAYDDERDRRIARAIGKPRFHTIADARAWAKSANLVGMIIIEFDGMEFSVVSYGTTMKRCKALARVNNQIYDMLQNGTLDIPEVWI